MLKQKKNIDIQIPIDHYICDMMDNNKMAVAPILIAFKIYYYVDITML